MTNQTKVKAVITQEKLKELFNYDPLTGVFNKKVNTSSGNLMPVGSRCKNDYLRVIINRKQYLIHRLAWLYVHGKFPENDIDHIDGNSLNNRIANLRDVAHHINQRNSRQRSDNNTGCTGVYWDKQKEKYKALIQFNNKLIHLGVFEQKWDAICSRLSANYKYGFHKNHGMPRFIDKRLASSKL